MQWIIINKISLWVSSEHRNSTAWRRSRHAIDCGAENKMAPVETMVKSVNIQRHTRSMTIAANFQSLQISCRTPSLRIRPVRNLTSFRTSMSNPHSVAASTGAAPTTSFPLGLVLSKPVESGICQMQLVSFGSCWSACSAVGCLSFGAQTQLWSWLLCANALLPAYALTPVMLSNRKSSSRSRTLASRLRDEFCWISSAAVLFFWGLLRSLFFFDALVFFDETQLLQFRGRLTAKIRANQSQTNIWTCTTETTYRPYT